MVNTRRTKFMKKKEGRSRVSQPQEENEVGQNPTVIAPTEHEVSKAKTYVEALKSPKTDSNKKRSGWKIQVSPRGDAQMTLEASFDAGRLVREAKMLKRKALLEQDQIEASSEDIESSSTSSSSSEEDSSSLESESSDTSIEAPAPKKKTRKDNKKKAAKQLAKQAKKKGDKKSKRSILEHVKEAQKATSDVVGEEIEVELSRIETKLAEWKKKKVEPFAIQRFAARILAGLKELKIVCSVDHAIFQQEMGRIHLLEMDLVETLDKTNDKTSLEAARNRANELLTKVFDSGATDRLERTLQGTTWRYHGDSTLNTAQEISTGLENTTQIPELESVNDGMNRDWEQQQELNRPATPPPTSQGSLVIDENKSPSRDSNPELYPNTPPPNQQAASAEDGLPEGIVQDNSVNEPNLLDLSADPHGINQDLHQLSGEMDQSQWRVLHKLHASSLNHSRDIEALQEQVGPQITTTHYFLNGESEPQFFSNNYTVNENILGLKNSGLRTRRSLDSHITKYNQEVQLLKSSIFAVKEKMKSEKNKSSSTLNAVPNADEIQRYKTELTKIQEELKKELAKASSLSNGSAFNTLDLKARMVELENANKNLSHRLECTSKAVGVLKNERPSTEPERNLLEFEVKRLTERVEQLEKEDSDRHSRNLFSDLSESKISLLEKDVEELQKSVRLQLADSETNRWLKQKMEAFLETPEMANKFKSELRNFALTWVIQPRNLSKEIRDVIVKDAIPEIKKETLSTFESQRDRMKRMAQEGMAKLEDIPNSANLSETKRTLNLNLKTDMKKAMNIITSAMMDLLTGIEDIFLNANEMNGTEMSTLDMVMGGKILVKFVRSLSSSDEGLLKMIEDLRVWEFLAPLIKKDKLNALIVALKGLKSPVKASTVMMMVKEGVPTRLDELVDHLTEVTVKELGSLELITVAPWNSLATKSSIELSSTSIANPVPLHTSSRTDTSTEQSKNDASTRVTLDKIKERFRNASSALDR